MRRLLGRTAPRLAGLALLGTVCSSATGEQTVGGRVLHADDVGRVWIAAVGADSRHGDWTLVEGGQFELPVSPVSSAGPGESPSGDSIEADRKRSGAPRSPTGVAEAGLNRKHQPRSRHLVAVAKDRVPLAIPFPTGEQGRQLELRLSQGLALEGSVRSEDGAPLRGVTIRAVRADTVVHDTLGRAGFAVSLQDATVEIRTDDGRVVTVPAAVRPTWDTDRHGAFRVAGLVAGRYLVEATAAGHVPVLREAAVRESGANRLDVVLQEAFFVAGHVVDEAGAPVAGAAVSADWRQPHEAGAGRHESVVRSSRRRTTVATGDDGSFRLGPFEAGPTLPVFATSAESGSSRRQEATAPFDGLVLQLRRHVVRGRVVDAATGDPLRGFRVHANRNGRMRTTSHADGRFETVVDPDTDSIHVEAAGRFPWFTRLFTSRGGVYDLGAIALQRERSVTGRVRNATSGEPIAGAVVRRGWRHYEDPFERVFTANWFGARFALTRADGTFELHGLPPGSDRLELVGTGGTFVRFVDVPAETDHLEIELALDGTVAGLLVRPEGDPVEGVVRLTSSTGDRAKREVSADGVFRWDGLGPGEYRITGDSSAGAVTARSVTLRAGESVEGLRLVVEPGGRVSGAVVGLLRGERATVEVSDRDGEIVLARDFGNGAYVLQGVPDEAVLGARTTSGRHLVRPIRLDDIGSARVDIDFSGNARLTGTARADGRPLGGIDLAVVPLDPTRPVAHATTGEFGRYTVQGLSEGHYALRTRTGHAFEVYVAADTTLDIDLPANSVSGTVRAGATERPVGGGWARLARVEGAAGSPPVVLGMAVASDGRFRFDGLAAGEYVVSVAHRDSGDVSQRLHVAGDQLLVFRLESSLDSTEASE